MEAYKIQRSEEWVHFRKDKIGASDAPIIMGLSPWMTSKQLWEEKKGLRSSREWTEAMKKGVVEEPLAIQYVESLTGISFKPDVKVYKKNPKIIASLDGINEENKIILECKCSQRYYKMASSEMIFPDVYCQIQHQLLVTELEDALLCCFDGIKGKILEVKKDHDFIEEMLEGEVKFLKSLEDNISPEEENIKKIEIPDFEQRNLYEWITISKQLKDLEKKEKELRGNLTSLSSDDKVVLLCDGHPMIKMTKITREGSVDWKSFCKDHGLDLEKSENYRKKSTSYHQLKAM